jgi:hypothetical protein
MERATGDGSAHDRFTFTPLDKAIGIIDDPADAVAAIRELRVAGYAADEVEVLAGEEGARRIDVTAEGQEALLHVLPSTQGLQHFYDAPIIVRRLEEALRAGHYGISVTAKGSEGRERVRELLKSHGGHFINFYGSLTAQQLEP